MSEGRKFFIIKTDDNKENITMKYEADTDFFFDRYDKSVLKTYY